MDDAIAREKQGLLAPALDRLLRLNRGPMPLGGDSDTIAQSGIDPWHPFEASTSR